MSRGEPLGNAFWGATHADIAAGGPVWELFAGVRAAVWAPRTLADRALL